jgi:hypothetical protein
MFIQVIQGKTEDPAGIKSQMDKWEKDLKPGSYGYLGSTSGVTEDGTFITVARFSSEEEARRNSDRPEQGEWWQETEKLYSGTVTFTDYTKTGTFGAGGSDDAGFVQIIQGRSSDVERLNQLNIELDASLRERRPELIGGTYGYSDDGQFTEAVYFTSEAEARKGEREMSDNPPAEFEEWQSLITDVSYFDLKSPYLRSP